MLSVDEALERILAAAPEPLPAESVALADVSGRAIATDLLADSDLPPFDNSMVDGFAVRTSDVSATSFPIVGEAAAGGEWPAPLDPETAVRVYTGAPIPENATGIIMVEDTVETARATGDWVTLTETSSLRYIRRRGSDIAVGAIAIPAGATIGSGEIGLLASLNRQTIDCPRRPRVGLLTTGDELIPVGDTPLRPGAIRNSNAPALIAAIDAAGATLTRHRHAHDSPDAIDHALDNLADCDVIISVGGVSVGARDFVKPAIERRGQLDFWRIAVKPGKPLAFGRLQGTGDRLQGAGSREQGAGSEPESSPAFQSLRDLRAAAEVRGHIDAHFKGWIDGGRERDASTQHPTPILFFGLPGNPVSSLVTFELFVRPVLRRLAGHTRIHRPMVRVTLTAALPHEMGRREFVRARLEFGEDGVYATPTGAQGSHRLHSMVGIDALLIAHESRADYDAGETLPALLLAS